VLIVPSMFYTQAAVHSNSPQSTCAPLDYFGDFLPEVRLDITQPRQAAFVLNCVVQESADDHSL
jgi:hypothetical protein